MVKCLSSTLVQKVPVERGLQDVVEVNMMIGEAWISDSYCSDCSYPGFSLERLTETNCYNEYEVWGSHGMQV
jgi:hypothetical protein